MVELKGTQEVFSFIDQEEKRQASQLELIASENFVSPDVRKATGSVLTHKYAEGYPAKRYYGGCEIVDEIESLAQERLKKLFQAEAVNVQPHSGSQANMAVYFSSLQPGDRILSMDLAQGGHLTHGAAVNFSGQLYEVIHYGVNQDGWLDMNQVRDLAQKHRPKMIVAGASAYSRKIPFKEFKEIADEIGAITFADIAHPAGLIATGHFPSPVPYFDFVSSTTHKTLRGPRGGIVMMQEGGAKKLNSKLFPGIQGGPLMHVIAAKAIAFGEALQESFSKYSEQVIKNAQVLAESLQSGGLDVVSGGTDSHLVLVDLRPFKTTGADAETALERAGMTVNKNMIPGDPQPPRVSSGIRLGTPALTTRGFREAEMRQVAHWMIQSLQSYRDEAALKKTHEEIREFCHQFPLFASD